MKIAELSDRLDSLASPVAMAKGLRHAAVLLGIRGKERSSARILAIQRARHLRRHPGQIAFPGGQVEAGDQNLQETALRESEEEIGLPRERVRLLGRLSTVFTPGGYTIAPFVGLIDDRGWEPRVDPEEVARTLDLAVQDLLDPERLRVVGQREFGGREYTVHAYDICDPPLWGVSARMVRDLLRRWDLLPSGGAPS